jgi:D-lactate dehydrogenase (cytochrome)
VNELKPTDPGSTGDHYRTVAGWEKIKQGYLQYLSDESRMAADRIEALHFPTNAGEVASAVQTARAHGHRVAVSGARTGIAGAAVPQEAEEVISLEHMKARPVVRRNPEGHWAVRVPAAVTLAELAYSLDHGQCEYPDGKPETELFYPVDSTETSAQIGGTISTNASGARTLFYGPTRDWVTWLKVVTPDGRILALRRGQVAAEPDTLVYHRADGSTVEVAVPNLPLPPTKHTAGYYLKHGMDALDLFIGSEGTLGIVCEAELRLAPKPAHRLYLTQFVDDHRDAVRFVHGCKRHPDLSPLALEYIGPRALTLLRREGRQTPAYVEVSRLPEDAGAAVYAEIPFDEEPELGAAYDALDEVLGCCGLSADHSWAGFQRKDLEEMKRLRHAVPETVNGIIGRRKREIANLHKVGTDMAVPDESVEEMLEFYHRRLDEAGLEFVVFGHLGNGHVHVNMLPRDAEELEVAGRLYIEFAQKAVRLGGSAAAEHGIGRIKRQFVPIQFDDENVRAMRAVKAALDPEGVLNPGVLFEE